MADEQFDDFELRIVPDGDGRYRSIVQSSPGGQIVEGFSLAPAGDGSEGLSVGVNAADLAAAGPEAVARFGQQLRDLVFGGDVGRHLLTSLARADERGTRLRLQLWLSEVPELASWPWEYVYHPDRRRGEHWCFSAGDPTLVRCLDLDEDTTTLPTKPPLRILIVISQPTDLESLDGHAEWEAIWTSLAEPMGTDGTIAVEMLRPPTVDALHRRLTRGDVDVLHFIGHGGLDPVSGIGRLYFEDEERGKRAVDARRLSSLLRRRGGPRLVVLNACESASATPGAMLGGLAQSLAVAGVPAVVGMQSQIWTQAAKRFAEFFYGQLAQGATIDVAVEEARRSLWYNDDTEWGVPVLYTRSEDGRMVDRAAFDAMNGRERQALKLGTWLALARERLRDGNADGAEAWLKRIPGNWGNANELRADVAALRGGSSEAALAGARVDHSVSRSARDRDEYYWLVKRLREGLVVPILGSDVNLCGRQSDETWQLGVLPASSSELAAHLVSSFDYPGDAQHGLARIAQYVGKVHGPGRLLDEMRKAFDDACRPTPLHELLAGLPAALRSGAGPAIYPLIVTTTYDQLLERAFDAAGEPYDLVSWGTGGLEGSLYVHTPAGEAPRPIHPPDTYDGLRLGERTTILRLVGALDPPPGSDPLCLITEDDHLLLIERDQRFRSLPVAFGEHVRRRHLLFLGFRPREWQQRAIARRVAGDQKATNPPWYVEAEVDDLEQRLWPELNARQLPVTLDQFVAVIRERLEQVP